MRLSQQLALSRRKEGWAPEAQRRAWLMAGPRRHTVYLEEGEEPRVCEGRLKTEQRTGELLEGSQSWGGACRRGCAAREGLV